MYKIHAYVYLIFVIETCKQCYYINCRYILLYRLYVYIIV